MKFRLIGDAIQTVAVELSPGEAVFSRMGTLLFARGGIRSQTQPNEPYWLMISRSVLGETDPPLVVYRCDSGGGLVGLHPGLPGKIHALSLEGSSRVVVARQGLLAGSEGLLVDPVKLDGEDSGEVPRRLFVSVSGSGWAFLHGPGNLVEFSLSPDEGMVIDGQMVLAMDGSVDFSPRPVGKPGVPGPLPYSLLLHTKGPGRILLHTLPRNERTIASQSLIP